MSPYRKYSKTPFKYNLPLVHAVGHCDLGTAVGRSNSVELSKQFMQRDAQLRKLGPIKSISIKRWEHDR